MYLDWHVEPRPDAGHPGPEPERNPDVESQPYVYPDIEKLMVLILDGSLEHELV